MSAGCAIVASDTQPVREAIKQGQTGKLIDFFDVKSLSNEICNLLDDPCLITKLGQNARDFAINNYDLQNVCLPKQIEWVTAMFE
jgi:glycosyltransferase involved in cell wall biosynthesis